MSLQSLHGPVSGSRRSSTIGSDGWRQNIIVQRSWFLAGPFTDRAAVGTLRPQMNFLMRLLLGLVTQIRGPELRGKRVKDWRSSSRIVERYWFWMAWSRSKIRLAHRRDGYGSLPSKHFCGNSLPSIRGCASLLRGRRSLILQIARAPRLCVVTWNNYPAMLAQNCSERWG